MTIRTHEALLVAWEEYKTSLNRHEWYLTSHVDNANDELWLTNATSPYLYEFARLNGLKLGLMWDERDALAGDFVEFKIFLYHSVEPEPTIIEKWKTIEGEIAVYVMENDFHNITTEYPDAYNNVFSSLKKRGLSVLVIEEDMFDSLIRKYVATPKKNKLPMAYSEFLDDIEEV